MFQMYSYLNYTYSKVRINRSMKNFLFLRSRIFEIIVPARYSQNYWENFFGRKRRIRKITFSAEELQFRGLLRNNFSWMESFFFFPFLSRPSFPLISYQKSRSSSQGKKRELTAVYGDRNRESIGEKSHFLIKLRDRSIIAMQHQTRSASVCLAN